MSHNITCFLAFPISFFAKKRLQRVQNLSIVQIFQNLDGFVCKHLFRKRKKLSVEQ